MKVKIQKIRKHKVEISFDGKAYLLWDELFNEYEYEESIEKLMTEYVKGLEWLVLKYGIEEDEKLTEDAIKFKKRINRYLKYDLY